jgi:hypothetical protein
MMKMAGRKDYVPNGIRDDTCVGMQPLSHARDFRESSKLQLHQIGVAVCMETARGCVFW